MRLCFYTLLAYDYRLAFSAVKSYYKIADEIILAVDSARLSFSGRPFGFDEKAVSEFISKTDTAKKIKLVQRPFHDASKDVTDNETATRNAVAGMFPPDATVIAINADEILLNPDEFWMWLSSNQQDGDIEVVSYTVFKGFDTRFLVAEPFKRVAVGKPNTRQYWKRRKTGDSPRVASPLRMLHNAWGRARSEVVEKLEHKRHSNPDAFLAAWDSASVSNHATVELQHPSAVKGEWLSLRLLPMERFGLTPEVKKEAMAVSMTTKCSIVCPIKNQYSVVKKCLESFERNCREDEVILIDDGSDEENTKRMIVEMAAKNSWKVFRNERSSGHTKASELGIKHATYENVFLVNSDVIVPKGGLKSMAKVLNDNADIAVVGPSTSSASGPQQVQEAHKERFAWSIEQIDAFADSLKGDAGLMDLALVNGFCFGIKKSIFVKLGGLDKAMSAYGNEKELLIRVRKAGYRTVWAKGSYVHHYGKMSYGGQKDFNIGQCQIDSDRYILKKHGRLS